MCNTCRQLLNEGLNLCVRARKLEAQERTNVQREISGAGDEWWDEHGAARADKHNELFPDQPMMAKSGTIHMWVEDQYDTDLADWERRSRKHLMDGCQLNIEEKT